MVVAALTGMIVHIRRSPPHSTRRRSQLRAIAITGAAALVLVVPPVLALAQHESGNLADLVRSMRHPPAAYLGLPDAWRAVAIQFRLRAPWLGSGQPLTPFSTTVDVHNGFPLSVGLVVFIVVFAMVVATRVRRRIPLFFAVVGAGIVAAVVSLARLLGPLFFWIPEWTRALAFGVWFAVLWGGYELIRPHVRWRRMEAVVAVGLSTGLLVLSIACIIDAARTAPTANPSVDAVHRLAQAALPEVRDGTSLVTATRDPSQLLGSDPGMPTLVLDLERGRRRRGRGEGRGRSLRRPSGCTRASRSRAAIADRC